MNTTIPAVRTLVTWLRGGDRRRDRKPVANESGPADGKALRKEERLKAKEARRQQREESLRRRGERLGIRAGEEFAITDPEASPLNNLGLRFQTDKASRGHDYLRHYEMYFAPFREEEFTLVEIGGLRGASLKVWEEYFPKARIVCMDISPLVKTFENDRTSVEIGNAADVEFLGRMKAKYGKARFVMDDGSHRWDHQRIAFKELFSMVEPGGYYVVEGLNSNYSAGFAGNDDTPFVQVLKTIVDSMPTRGETKRLFLSTNNHQLMQIARQVDAVIFIRHACLIRKAFGRTLEAAADTDVAPDAESPPSPPDEAPQGESPPG